MLVNQAYLCPDGQVSGGVPEFKEPQDQYDISFPSIAFTQSLIVK